MADKIDFSGVGRYKRRDADGQTYTPANQITFAEPLWLCDDGVIIPLSQINNKHLQHIERWLRKGGATLPPQLLIDTWKDIIRAELDKRGLALLPDHPKRKDYVQFYGDFGEPTIKVTLHTGHPTYRINLEFEDE